MKKHASIILGLCSLTLLASCGGQDTSISSVSTSGEASISGSTSTPVSGSTSISVSTSVSPVVEGLSYIFLNNETDGQHYEVYYNGNKDLPETTVIESTYNDGTNGEHPVTGFYYNETDNKGAFENCNSLRYITVPNSIKSISKRAFRKCNKLINFELDYDSEIVSVGEEAFFECANLTFYRINPKLKSIGKFAFEFCPALVNLYDYDNNVLESIGEGAFMNDYSLYEVPRFNELKTVENNAFSRCCALETFICPSITSLGEGAFHRCHNLSSFQFGNTSQIEVIPKSCFYECRSLTLIGIPYKVDTIDDYAFASCSSLNFIDGPLYIEHIGVGAFQECTSLVNPPINSTLLTIGNEAFLGCTSIGTVTIPSSVTSIGKSVFNGCVNLKSLTVDSSNPYFDSRDNSNAVITTVEVTSGTETIPANTLIAQSPVTVIPHSVTNIYDGAYYHVAGIKSLTIPNSVTSVNKYFVSTSDDLESIVFESGSPITILPTHTFFLLKVLTTLVLPDQLETISAFAFDHLLALEEITIPTTVTSIGQEIFFYNSYLSVIHYNGTMEQFNAIEKHEKWVVGASPDLVVRCTDGDIPVES